MESSEGRNRHTLIMKHPTPVGIDGQEEFQPTARRNSEKSDQDSGTIEADSKCVSNVQSPIGRKTLLPISELVIENRNKKEERLSHRGKFINKAVEKVSPTE